MYPDISMTHVLIRTHMPLRALFILALSVSFVVALLPAPEAIELSGGRDKIGHFLAFFGLGVLGYAGWPHHLTAVTLALLAYGAAMELAQSMTTWRHGDFGDWIADAAGVLAALVVHLVWRRLRR